VNFEICPLITHPNFDLTDLGFYFIPEKFETLLKKLSDV